MKSRSTVLFTICVVLAIAQDGTEGGSCPDLNQKAMKQTAGGHLAEAEASLGQSACAGHILSNLAKAMFVMGRLHDAERLAEQSISDPGEILSVEPLGAAAPAADPRGGAVWNRARPRGPGKPSRESSRFEIEASRGQSHYSRDSRSAAANRRPAQIRG